jgi:hypothetical protein
VSSTLVGPAAFGHPSGNQGTRCWRLLHRRPDSRIHRPGPRTEVREKLPSTGIGLPPRQDFVGSADFELVTAADFGKRTDHVPVRLSRTLANDPATANNGIVIMTKATSTSSLRDMTTSQKREANSPTGS